jgi:hypothetical protein
VSFNKVRAIAVKNVLLNHSCLDCKHSITRNIWGVGDNITFCGIHDSEKLVKRKKLLGLKHICELYENDSKKSKELAAE